jgi:hypothetical protein
MRVKAPQQSSGKIVDRRLLPLSTEAGQLEVVGRGRPDASDGLHFHHHTIQISRQAKSAAPACEPQIRAAFMPDEPRSVNLDESSASTTQPTEAPQELALQFKPHPIASLTVLFRDETQICSFSRCPPASAIESFGSLGLLPRPIRSSTWRS